MTKTNKLGRPRKTKEHIESDNSYITHIESDNSYITQEPIESIPSEPIKSGRPHKTEEHIESEAQNFSISQNLVRGSETSNNVNLISQIDVSNLTEHIDDIRQDIDETPQIPNGFR